MIRILIIVLIVATANAGEPIPATQIKLDVAGYQERIKAIRNQTGFDIEYLGSNLSEISPHRGLYEKQFWTMFEKFALDRGNVIRLSNHGRTIHLERGTVVLPSSIDGPFRIVVTGVTSRSDLAAGKTFYDVTLLIHWEPRFPVFRIDSVPAILTAVDDRGTKLTSQASKTKSPIGDAYVYTTTIRLDGLTRDSKTIAKLEGSFVVTASPKMLAFTFDDFTKQPVEKKESNISVTLSKFASVGERWDVELKLLYPEGHPEFESFETWADNNKLKLISPDRTKIYTPANFSTSGSGRRVTAEYRFLKLPMKDANGWSLVYEAPAPLTEYTVKFALKDIPLP